MGNEKTENEKRSAWKNAFWLCLGGVLINVVGILLAQIFGAPLFFDATGTILAAIAGGYFPGILVGFATGVAGIVASKVAERYRLPAIMICLKGGVGRGSCSSVISAVCTYWLRNTDRAEMMYSPGGQGFRSFPLPSHRITIGARPS